MIKIRLLLDNENKPVAKKVSPGLSSFGETPWNATDHMWLLLLDYVAEHIPTVKHKETSLFIIATAGLRLIPDEFVIFLSVILFVVFLEVDLSFFRQSSAILANLGNQLPKMYDFIVMDQHIEMISGKWEGIYSWIAVNYV